MMVRLLSLSMALLSSAAVFGRGVFEVKSFGAKGDGLTKDTAAVQAAVDAANAAGGGEVLLEAGTYLCGTIWLKSNVDFHLGPGAVLKGSVDPADYNRADAYQQNWSSPRNSENQSGGHLLIALEQHDITVRGPGKIDGSGLSFATYPDGGERYHQRDYEWRPGQMFHIVECDDVRISDVKFTNSTYWNCFIHGCRHVFVRGVRVDTPVAPHILNGDGFTIDACMFVTISDCQIVAYDDGLTIRCDQKRLKRHTDCANITVENCTISSKMNAIRVGVGDGFIHDVVFNNIVVFNTRTAINFCSSWGMYGTDIRRVRFNNFSIESIDFLRMHQNGKVTPVEDIYFSNVSGYVRQRSRIWAKEGYPFRNIKLRGIDLPQGIEVLNVEGFSLEDSALKQIPLSPEATASRNRDLREGRDILY